MSKEKWEVSFSNWQEYANIFKELRTAVNAGKLIACDELDARYYKELLSALDDIEKTTQKARYSLEGYITKLDDNERLKPCPFCESKAHLFANDELHIYRVTCHHCFATTRPYNNKQDAIDAWNKRGKLIYD